MSIKLASNYLEILQEGTSRKVSTPHLAIRKEPSYIYNSSKLFRKEFWLVNSNFCVSNSNSYKI
jgi:hypothetical protein